MNGPYHQTNDNRPESFRPRQDEMVHVECLDTKKNWLMRRTRLGSLIGETTMCELLARNPKGGMTTPSPSLGLIKPTDIETSVIGGDPWTPAEQAKVNLASELVRDVDGAATTRAVRRPLQVPVRRREVPRT